VTGLVERGQAIQPAPAASTRGLPRGLAAAGAALLLALAAAAAALVTAVWPLAALSVAVAAAAVAVAGGARGRSLAMRPAVAAAVAAGLVAIAVPLGVWPATTVLTLLAAAAVALGLRAPAAALALAVLMMGLEGSVKLLLSLDPTPIPGGARPVGAVVIDLALVAALAGTLLADRGRTGRLMWERASGAERAAAAALGGWLVASVLQIVQGGHPVRGLEGWRLFPAYSLVAVAAAVACARPAVRERATRVILWVGLAISAYAAFRVAFGPATAERAAAHRFQTVTDYGKTFRAVGSFSSAVGLASFMTPVTVFALVTAYLEPRMRRLALATGLLALVALLGSYSRASLVGVVLGVACAAGLLLFAADSTRRRKLAAVGLVVVTLAVAYGGVQIASHSSPRLHERAQGLLNPFGDASMKLRFKTWDRTLKAIGREPLGYGIGTVGSASAPTRRHLNTADNSFLKVLYEQGVVAGALFVGGVLAAIVLLARRLRRLPAQARAGGLAALAGFVAFLALALTGEYVEQPGKVAAWGLFGVAVAMAFALPGDPPAEAPA
jgi:hypothetical protein